MFEIRLPRLGWSMEEGVFVGWLKLPGTMIHRGDPILEMEGEKALQEIEAVDGGVLFIPPQAPPPGSTIPVGTLLGYLLQPGEAPPGAESSPSQPVSGLIAPPPAGPAVRRLAREMGVDLHEVTGSSPSGKITAQDVTSRAARRVAEPQPVRTTSGAASIASPRARRVASELGIDWRGLPGTGREGRIREADVRAVAETGTPSGAKSITISPRRKAIADRLRLSRERTIPVTLTTTADATALVALRKQFKTSSAAIVPAFTDLIAHLIVRTMSQHPALSVIWDAQHRGLISLSETERHVGIAVDTPDGLLVPVVRQVAAKSLVEIAEESKALIALARSGRLPSDRMQGGVITITNLGAYGIDAFTPIINYPEIAILGLGAIRRVPVVLPDDRIEPRDRMTLSLTFDHAAIDGAPAAAFLRDVVTAMESPPNSEVE